MTLVFCCAEAALFPGSTVGGGAMRRSASTRCLKGALSPLGAPTGGGGIVRQRLRALLMMKRVVFKVVLGHGLVIMELVWESAAWF